MLYILTRLLGLGLLLVVLTSLGAALSRRLGNLSGSVLDGTLIRLALGAILASNLLLLLAASQLYRPAVLLGLSAAGLLLAGILSWRRLRSRPETFPAGRPDEPARPALEKATLFLLAAGGAFLTLILALQAMRPDVAWDANVYHLTLPRQFLEHGGFFRVPWNVYSNWPLGIQLLYGWALAVDGRTLANLLHLAFGLAAALAAVRLAADANRNDLFAWAAAFFFLGNPVVLYEIRIAYVDLAGAFFLAAAFLALERVSERGVSGRELLLPGLLVAGSAISKLNGFSCALALAGAFVLVGPPGSGFSAGLARRARRSLWLLLPSLLLLLPWLAKSWLLTGNPVYPFFFSWFGGPDWSAELSAKLVEWQRSIGMGRSFTDSLLLPLRVILASDLGYGRFDGALARGWIVLLPLAVWGAFRDRRSARLLTAAGIFFLLWAASAQQTRLLIPILPLVAAASARSLRRLAEVLPAARRSWAAAGVAALALAWVAPPSLLYARQAPRLAADLLRQGRALEAAVVHPVYRFVNTELPAQARLLLVGTNHGFFLERPFYADSFFEASQIEALLPGSADEVRRRLAELGVTHVLVDLRTGLRPASAGLRALLQDPRHAAPLFTSADGRFRVLALAATPP